MDGPRPLLVAVTGATGFVGRALVASLTADGHRVRRLGRHAPAAGSDDARWDPARGELDPAALDGVDAVVHLAGENLAQRWTDGARRRIRESRTQGTALVARTLARLDRPPRVLVSGSAIGFYGNAGEREVDESSPPGTGFLAEVVQAWEEAAEPARAAGIRVVHPRLGVVLGAEGGALAKLLPPFRLGLGGPVGDGDQWMSWISRDDAVAALRFLLEADGVAGPVNLVAPRPARNAELAAALGRVLHRPAVTPVPAFALRALYGQMAEETLLVSQRVAGRRLREAGFRFRHPELEDALRAAVG